MYILRNKIEVQPTAVGPLRNNESNRAAKEEIYNSSADIFIRYHFYTFQSCSEDNFIICNVHKNVTTCSDVVMQLIKLKVMCWLVKLKLLKSERHSE